MAPYRKLRLKELMEFLRWGWGAQQQPWGKLNKMKTTSWVDKTEGENDHNEAENAGKLQKLGFYL